MENTVNKSAVIKTIIVFAIAIVIALLPTTEVFTYQMKMSIAFTVWLLMWSAFDLTNLAVPATVWAIGLIMLNVVPASVVLSPWVGGTTMYGVVGSLLFANILNRTGILKRVAYWVAIRCGGNFNRCVYAIFMATFAVSIVTFCTGSVMCAALSYGFVSALGLVKKKEGAIVMMAGMLGASTTRMFMYYPVTMGCLLGSVNPIDPNFTINLGMLIKYNWPVLLFCLLFIFLMEFFGKTNKSDVNGGVEYFKSEYAKLGKMSSGEIKCAIAIVLLLAWIMAGKDGMAAFLIIAMVLCMPGINVGTSEDIENVPWSTVLFFGSCMAIGSVCSAVGITAMIGQAATPILSALGASGTLIGTLLFGVVANFCMTPVAMLAGFSGMLYTLAVNVGVNPLAVLFTFNYATDMVLLPYEYLTFLVFYAFGAMTMGQFFKYHAAKCVVFTVFFVIIIIPFWNIIGLI